MNFENTEIAFRSKSDGELKRAWLLFKLIGFPALVKALKPLATASVRLGGPFKTIIRHSIFKHFCGGENIEDCNPVIKHLADFKVMTILDYSVEGMETDEDFDNTTREIIKTQEKASRDGNIPFCVFKPTGIARFELLEKISNGTTLNPDEESEYERVRERIDMIFKIAFNKGIPVMVDAEESWIQEAVDNLVIEGMKKYNREKPIIYNTLQMYRSDRLEILEKWFDLAVRENFVLGFKLVRGAYMEKERERAENLGLPCLIHSDKTSTDRDYNEALKFIIDRINRIAICAGTHNELSCRILTELMIQANIPSGHRHIFFSQLFGMGDHLSFNLANSGYNVAKYIPYGPVRKVIPYLMRRAEENTSVSGQSSRELLLLSKELNRRRNSHNISLYETPF